MRETAETITRDDLRRLIEARPFRPFTLILEGGARLRASHPECLHVGDNGRLVVTDDSPGEASGIIERIELDPVPFGPTPRRKAKRGEVEAVLSLAWSRFGAGLDEVRALAMDAGVGATWAALRLAEAEGLTRFETVRARAFQLAALRMGPGTVDPAGLPVVRLYAACVVAVLVGDYSPCNAALARVAEIDPGAVTPGLKHLEEAGLIERIFERPNRRGRRKLRAVDFAVEPAPVDQRRPS